MVDAIFGTIFLGGIFVLWLASWCRKQQLKSYLFDHVSWCVVEDNNKYVNSKHLLDQICVICSNAAETAAIEKKYHICCDDEAWALDVLDAFRSYLSEVYFKGSLKIESAKVSRDEYFMLSLCSFLEARECSTTFNGKVMYEQLEITHYGTWGTQLYTATYDITHYGVVFNKLLYIARTYCENNKHINKKQALFHKSEGIRERLDSNRITISVL